MTCSVRTSRGIGRRRRCLLVAPGSSTWRSLSGRRGGVGNQPVRPCCLSGPHCEQRQRHWQWSPCTHRLSAVRAPRAGAAITATRVGPGCCQRLAGRADKRGNRRGTLSSVPQFPPPLAQSGSFFLSRRALCGQATWRERRPHYMRFIHLPPSISATPRPALSREGGLSRRPFGTLALLVLLQAHQGWAIDVR